MLGLALKDILVFSDIHIAINKPNAWADAAARVPKRDFEYRFIGPNDGIALSQLARIHAQFSHRIFCIQHFRCRRLYSFTLYRGQITDSSYLVRPIPQNGALLRRLPTVFPFSNWISIAISYKRRTTTFRFFFFLTIKIQCFRQYYFSNFLRKLRSTRHDDKLIHWCCNWCFRRAHWFRFR